MTLRRLVVLTATALALISCAPARVPWQNAQVPKDQWSRDWSECKREAERSVIGFNEDYGGSSPLREYDRAQAKRQINSQVAMCMTDRGYQPRGD